MLILKTLLEKKLFFIVKNHYFYQAAPFLKVGVGRGERQGGFLVPPGWILKFNS